MTMVMSSNPSQPMRSRYSPEGQAWLAQKMENVRLYMVAMGMMDRPRIAQAEAKPIYSGRIDSPVDLDEAIEPVPTIKPTTRKKPAADSGDVNRRRARRYILHGNG